MGVKGAHLRIAFSWEGVRTYSSIWDGATVISACQEPLHSKATNLKTKLKITPSWPHRCSLGLCWLSHQAENPELARREGWDTAPTGTDSSEELSPGLHWQLLLLLWRNCHEPWSWGEASTSNLGDLYKKCIISRAERAMWERENEDQKTLIIQCAPLVKSRVRTCDEKTEGKEVKWAEMPQYKEKMNNKTSSRHKEERETLSSHHYGTTGEDKWHSKPSKRKEFKRKNKWRKRTKKTSEGKNFVTHLLQHRVLNLESQHWAIHYSAATKKAQVLPSTPLNLKFILYAIISIPSHILHYFSITVFLLKLS